MYVYFGNNLHFMSTTTLAAAGTEMLLLLARHVRVVETSSLPRLGIDNVLDTVCWYVSSHEASIIWPSRHQETAGAGSPETQNKVSTKYVRTSKLSPSPKCCTDYLMSWYR